MDKMLKLPSESDLNTEYNVMKNRMATMTGSKDVDSLVFGLTSAKKSVKTMRILGIMMIIFGVLTLIIGVGFLLLIGGFFLLRIAKVNTQKYDIFIEKAKNDPDLIKK